MNIKKRIRLCILSEKIAQISNYSTYGNFFDNSHYSFRQTDSTYFPVSSTNAVSTHNLNNLISKK